MTLYINSSVREDSRTDRLARALLEALGEPFTELTLRDESITPLTREGLNLRTGCIAAKDYSCPAFSYAKQFAAADKIVISAPYWDMSFPSLLKVYLENIYVTGLVSYYGEDGRPVGLCRAGKLYYVTTAGGVFDTRFGYDYVRALCTDCFGIGETCLIKAELLDIRGNDPEKIMEEAVESVRLSFGHRE